MAAADVAQAPLPSFHIPHRRQRLFAKTSPEVSAALDAAIERLDVATAEIAQHCSVNMEGSGTEENAPEANATLEISREMASAEKELVPQLVSQANTHKDKVVSTWFLQPVASEDEPTPQLIQLTCPPQQECIPLLGLPGSVWRSEPSDTQYASEASSEASGEEPDVLQQAATQAALSATSLVKTEAGDSKLAGIKRAGYAGHYAGKLMHALTTSGDGACALHGLLATGPDAKGELFLPEARSRLLQLLPANALEGLAAVSQSAGGQNLFNLVRDACWGELLQPHCVAKIEGRNGSREGKLLFQALTEDHQLSAMEFVAAAKAEREIEKKRVAEEYLPALRQFFAPENEHVLARPFLQALGMIPATTLDLRNMDEETLAIVTSQLDKAALFDSNAVLEAVSDSVHTYKYQALFDQSRQYDILRDSLFACWRHTGSRHDDKALLQALLETSLGGNASDSQRVLATRLKNLVSWRFSAISQIDRPPQLTAEVLWTALRAAMATHGYWLSVDELLLVASLSNHPVEIVKYHAGCAEFRLLGCSHGPDTPATVVALQAHATRGHFSRLSTLPIDALTIVAADGINKMAAADAPTLHSLGEIDEQCAQKMPECGLSAEAATMPPPLPPPASPPPALAVAAAVREGLMGEAAPKSCKRAKKGGKTKDSKDYSFAVREVAIQFCETHEYIKDATHRPRRMTNKPASVTVPTITGQHKLSVHKVLEWARRRIAEKWDKMKHHPAIADDWGKDWWAKRSRIHNSWLVEMIKFTPGMKRKPAGRHKFINKFPRIKEVLQKADREHSIQRKRKHHCDFDGFATTAAACLKMTNAELNDMDMPLIAGPKMSRSWVYQQSLQLEAKTERVHSQEAKTVDPAERVAWHKEYTEKIKRVGDIRFQQSWDEFNGFNDRSLTHCLTHREEEQCRKGHVHRKSRGRESWTGGLCYGPLHKGFAMYIGKQIPQDTIDQLDADYGKVLKVVSTPSGNISCETHVEAVLPLMAESADRCRRLHDKLESLVLQKEDRAGPHIEDKDSHTKTVGWMVARNDRHRASNLLRHLYLLNATPDDCENDQLHAIFEMAVDQEIREFSGTCQNWLLRPAEDLMTNGMGFMTRRGYVRGANHYLIGASIARVWSRWPQTHCLASFVKTGTVPRDLAAQWVSHIEGGINLIMSDFGQLQEKARKAPKWQHVEQSGIAKGNPEPPECLLDLDWTWLQESGAIPQVGKAPTPVMQEELLQIKARAAVVHQKSSARTLVQIVDEIGRFEEAANVPEDVCGPEDASYRPAAGALAALHTKPGPHNAAQVVPFCRCVDALFKDTPTYKRRGAAFMRCVFEWQLWLLRNAWTTLRMDLHPSVKNVSQDMYAWRVIKCIHRMAHLADREGVALNMVGDYRRLSMNPKGAPKVPPKANLAINPKAVPKQQSGIAVGVQSPPGPGPQAVAPVHPKVIPKPELAIPVGKQPPLPLVPKAAASSSVESAMPKIIAKPKHPFRYPKKASACSFSGVPIEEVPLSALGKPPPVKKGKGA